MKWELVVTDVSAGKTGRVRIEAPDQATAERIAVEKGWSVSSVRPFDPPGTMAATPATFVPPGYAPRASTVPSDEPAATPAPHDAHASEESDEHSTESDEHSTEPDESADHAEESQEQENESYGAEPNEIPPYNRAAVVTENPTKPVGTVFARNKFIPPVMARGASAGTVTPAPAAAAIAEMPVASDDSTYASQTPQHAAQPMLPRLLAGLCWIVGIALIAWGIVQLSYFLGYARGDRFPEADSAGAAANRLSDIRAFVRAMLGGVMVAAGLLAGILATLLARDSSRRP